MTDPVETIYDATGDPRTGRPPLPIDVENARLAAHSEMETRVAEGNEAVASDEHNIVDEDSATATVEENGGVEDQEIDQDSEIAGEKINSTVARMRAPEEKEDDAGDVEVLKEENETLKRLLGEAVLENEIASKT
jgi:hypothetical protein